MRTSGDAASYSAYPLQVSGAARLMYYRNKTTDEPIIDQIIKGRQYDLRRLRRMPELAAFLDRRQSTTGKRPLVVDAGANIGASPVFFVDHIPGAKVVAIEPHADNFSLLKRNVEGLDVEPLHAAIASTRGRARVVDPGEGHWGYRTENLNGDMAARGTVARLTVGGIYQKHSDMCFPFLVKIDIEGGEGDLFSANTEWVAQTPILIVELHDWLLTRSGNSRSFLQCVSKLDRDFVYIGEDIYSIANDLGQ